MTMDLAKSIFGESAGTEEEKKDLQRLNVQPLDSKKFSDQYHLIILTQSTDRATAPLK